MRMISTWRNENHRLGCLGLKYFEVASHNWQLAYLSNDRVPVDVMAYYDQHLATIYHHPGLPVDNLPRLHRLEISTLNDNGFRTGFPQ